MSEVKSVLGMEDVGTDEGIKRIVDSLSSEKDIEGKTELNTVQVVAIARAAWYGKKYKSKSMQAIVLLVSKYLQSKGRMGRTEMVDALKSLLFLKANKEGKQEVKV